MRMRTGVGRSMRAPGLVTRGLWAQAALVILLAATLSACGAHAPRASAPATLSAADEAFLDTLERRTFDWFWDLTDARTGLTPDRAPTPSFSSVAACGFALTAYPIGAERGYITRAAAAERTRQTLEAFWRAPQDSSVAGAAGYRGLYYHFLDMSTGLRFRDVELSTIDTALLLAGALFCQSYFDRGTADERRIRTLADSLYLRVEWTWMQVRPPTIALSWSPEEGAAPYDWRGYNEAMLLHVMALGSPTHPVGPEVWQAWTSRYQWGTFYGQEHLGFAPLFGHQYSHVWIDYRGINEPWLRAKGIDYFENSRRATLAQLGYARANPSGFAGYGDSLWGLTACDGPIDATLQIDGRARTFRTYAARGASHTEVVDDGTISPSAAGGSVPFAPRETVAALRAMRMRFGEHGFNRYGFVDALNPTLRTNTQVQHGHIVPGVGWFDGDQLGIDQGPILAMIENQRTGLIWTVMRRNPHIVRGLRRAGFSGGWLDQAPKTP